MTEETGRSESTNVSGLAWALVGYAILFTLKVIAYLMTGLGVMYAEALHSVADMLISGFLLVAALWSRKPADENYRLGYGRAQNVAALVAATIFISFTALEAFREAMNKLFGGEAGSYSNLMLGIAVTGVAIFVSAFPLINIWWSKEKGAATRAQFIESVNDEIALLAALVGILLVSQGILIADGIASLVVAIVIAFNASGLWWQNAQDLMGRSPGQEFYNQVAELAKSVKGVVSVHDMRAEMLGGQAHLEMHIEVPRGMTIEEADRIAEEVEREIGKKIAHAYCTIHVDPAVPEKGKQPQPDLTQRKPTDMLEEEHRFIRQVVGAMPVLVEALESGQKVKAETLESIVEFMRIYADRCHHGKEEAHLFSLLEKKGVPMSGCPVGALTFEHQQGRTLVNALAAAAEAYGKGDDSSTEPLLSSLRSLMNLYPNHIWKEDLLLFPMTNKLLSPDEQKELLEKFDSVENMIGRDVHQRFEQLADRLLASLVSD